ncbi:MAG: CoA pyrophosphatase [Pseudomonadota bacterium]
MEKRAERGYRARMTIELPFKVKPVSTKTTDFEFHPNLRPENPKLKPAAVLVCLQHLASGWHVILTKRSTRLAHHPGQVSFPGGKVEPTDGTAMNAALREAEEEIGLPRVDVQVVGSLPAHETVTGFDVQPYIAVVPTDFKPLPERYEVDEVFYVPLEHVSKPANFMVTGRAFGGIKRFYYTVPYGPHYIWGATARMLRIMCDCLEFSDES